MKSFNAYRTWQGWIITATEGNRTMYLQKVHNGEYTFCRDYTYAKAVSAKTASKHLTELTGLPILVNDRTKKLPKVSAELMKKGWSHDEAQFIADNIFRQYESNVMGLSVQAMVKRHPTKSEVDADYIYRC